MQIKHAINDPQSMSHDGGKILQSLQNNQLPLIDIIVRESLQNSLDATEKNAKKTEVDYIIGTFESNKLTPFFEEINEKLNRKYNNEQKFISFSDRNTKGLTGDYQSLDSNVLNKSNFHKLVFGIGQNQEQEGAGGSWGYGKTSYFRIGIGLVIYYTRIKTNKGYEERLIGSMIEDPASKERLLENNERGIAWWGQLAKDDTDRVFPITEGAKIEEILSIFNLKRYTNDETGTTIILPYVQNRTSELIDVNAQLYSWEKNYEEEIAMAIQRWYFPRIMNAEYSKKIKNSELNVKVNGEIIYPGFTFEPIFDIYQKIYNAAVSGKSEDQEIKIKDIKLGRNALYDQTEIVGRIAFKEVSKRELKMLPPHNKVNGLAYLGIKDDVILENFNAKIIGYSRKPGMVVEYAVDSPWSPSNINLKEEHILLGFFVPNSNAELIPQFVEAGYKNLEAYLRSIESSDHATWEDIVDMTLVTRMRNYTSRAIREFYQSEEEEFGSSATSGLSRKFGSILMPPKNYGKSSSRGGSTREPGTSTIDRTRNSDISVIQSQPIDIENVKVQMRIFLKSQSTFNVYVNISSIENNITEEEWKKNFNTKYPFEIKKMFINKVNDEEINLFSEDYNEEQANLLFTPLDKEFSVVQILNNYDYEVVIDCVLYIKRSSNNYLPNINIRNA